MILKSFVLFHVLLKVVYAGLPEEDQGTGAITAASSHGLEMLFGSGSDEIWAREYLQSAMSLQLVKKTWKPSGPSSNTSEKLDYYKWEKDEAYKNLRDSKPYEYVVKPLAEAHKLLTDTEGEGGSQFDEKLPNILIIHSLPASTDTNFVQTTVTALAMRNLHIHNNIFVLDMPSLNLNMFITLLNTALGQPAMYEPLAEPVGDFFIKAVQEKIMQVADIHLIGWSYSGQLVGYIGRYIREKINQPIGSIIALDPNGNAQNTQLENVNKDDAQIVHVYNSNSFPFGSLAREATADFTFNNGMIEPECYKNPLPMLCSHTHVVQRFWYVILYGPIIFKARECDNIMQFNSGACDENPTANLTYPIGNNPAKGSYYLSTFFTHPYGLREAGSLSSPQIRDQLQEELQKQRRIGNSNLDSVMLSTNFL